MSKKIIAVLTFLIYGIANATPTEPVGVAFSEHPVAKTSTVKSHKTHKKKNRKHKKSVPRNYMSGLASYYGGEDNFEGRRMANGDIFDSSDINVCAHPTLPLGTKLKVTNLANGRSIYVEVTDRMPRGNKVIDLSKGGARALGMHRHGVGRVELIKISESEFDLKRDNLEIQEGDNGTPH